MLGSCVFFGASNPGMIGAEATLPRDRIAQADAIVLQRICQRLAQGRTILAIRSLGNDQAVFGHSQVALLLQHVGCGRCSQVIFLLLGIQALRSEFASRGRRLNLRTIVGQRELGVDNLDADLDINLFQSKLVLPVFQHRARLRALRHPVPDRNVNVHANALVRRMNC